MSKILLIGDVVVDVTLHRVENKLRLGGVIHAARALWALGMPYDIAYCAPEYMDADVQKHSESLGAERWTRVGTITGCPNVMLIAEPTEAGNQGYDHLLRDAYRCMLDKKAVEQAVLGAEDIVVFSGNFSMHEILAVLSGTAGRVHADLGNGPGAFTDLKALGRRLDTLFISTSSAAFPSLSGGLPSSVQSLVGSAADAILLKENRGGARYFTASVSHEVGAQRRDIIHSVGVGDAFDAAFIALRAETNAVAALNYSAWLAAEYASTTFPDDFRTAVQRFRKITPDRITSFVGVQLPWERRRECQIYIAAPDFDYCDRTHIDALVSALNYHNFAPRLPIREHGQARADLGDVERRALCEADLHLLDRCGLLIAVLTFDDPGTLIEIGIAHGQGIPVLVYDPYRRAKNLMLTHTPVLVTDSLDRIITKTFDLVAERNLRT